MSKLAPYKPRPLAQVPRNTIIPAIHLARFSASSSPTVLCIGDSTTTPFACDPICVTDPLYFQLIRRMREDNPQKTINFVNQAIGGTSMSQYLSYVTGSLPAFYNVASVAWFVYGQAVMPDTVFINWGVNDSWGLHAATVKSVLTNIVGWGTAPPTWLANHAYAQNTVIVDSNGRLQVSASPGTTGASAPVWPTNVGGSVQDGGAVWVTMTAGVYTPKTPDIILITNKVANPAAGSPYGLPTYQSGYLSAASLLRSVAACGGAPFGISGAPKIGLIDTGRYFNMAVNGFDPVDQEMQQIIASPITGITTFPYVLPVTSGDFDVTWTIPGASMTSAVLSYVVAMADGTANGGNPCTLNLQTTNGSNVYASYYPGGGASSIGGIFSGSAFNGTGNNVIRITAKGASLYVQLNGVVVFDALVPRINCPFPPSFTITGQPAGFAATLTSYVNGTARQYAPLLTGPQVYGGGGSSGLTGGNGINHNSSIGLNAIDGRVLDAVRFA